MYAVMLKDDLQKTLQKGPALRPTEPEIKEVHSYFYIPVKGKLKKKKKKDCC